MVQGAFWVTNINEALGLTIQIQDALHRGQNAYRSQNAGMTHGVHAGITHGGNAECCLRHCLERFSEGRLLGANCRVRQLLFSDPL